MNCEKKIVETRCGPVEVVFDGNHWWDNRTYKYLCELPDNMVAGGYEKLEELEEALNL